MTAVSVTLIIIGIICVILSIVFNFDKTKESSENVSAELTKEQQDRIKKQINDLIDNELDNLGEKTEATLDRISNTKILEMNEYAENVLGEINRNHNETVFLYDMLNEKAKEIKSTVKDVNIAKRQVEKIHAEVTATDKEEDEEIPSTESSKTKDLAKERLVELVKISDSSKEKTLNMRKTQAEELERKKMASEVDKEVFKVVDFAAEKENIQLSEENSNKDVIKFEDANVFSEVKNDLEKIANKEDDLAGFEFEEVIKPEAKEIKEEVKEEVAADEVAEVAEVAEVKKVSKSRKSTDTTKKKSTSRKTSTKKDSSKVESLKKNINSVELSGLESNNDRILKLASLGFTNKDIAKYLNLGIGEVKLVVDLYKETK
ncbi:DUF6115 domain-containing protein [Lachnospira multipara]|uniref:DUF6115 domain-containing protein n=1 Tax=Lachnospira multipara TaxID=28051 RepID=UPI0004E1B8B3|nr:DUF6115 domain-containing protein [Lachnospira multipara]